MTMNHSFTLNSHGSTETPSAFSFNPLSSRKTANTFKASLRQAMLNLTAPPTSEHLNLGGELDTVVFPLLQMGFCGIKQDETVTKRLLSRLDTGESLYLASGYFNLPSTYTQEILQNKGICNILAASPQVWMYCFSLLLFLSTSTAFSMQANGFYGAKGVAGHVPVMYIHFAKKFLEDVNRSGNEDRVKYLEYERPGWTFHGKGLWYYHTGERHPSMTLVGSSNYGMCIDSTISKF